MPSASELVMMDPDELELRLAESRTELLNLRFQSATGQLDNTARLQQVRRDIARILTVLREREIEEAEGMFVPVATLGPTARRIREMDEAAAAEHPGDERYQSVLAEDEALVEELAEPEPEPEPEPGGDLQGAAGAAPEDEGPEKEEDTDG